MSPVLDLSLSADSVSCWRRSPRDSRVFSTRCMAATMASVYLNSGRLLRRHAVAEMLIKRRALYKEVQGYYLQGVSPGPFVMPPC